MAQLVFVFVHGYSVTNTDTYGELPLRLRNEAIDRGMSARVEDIYLGRYISFSDEVRLNDVSRAMQTAVQQQIQPGERFICITHSTGGPVVRNWWHIFYQENPAQVCPMSHLIMLAPANHGSTLAQLGKTKLSRIKTWFDGVEPGQRILDWLELGSTEAWELNLNWIMSGGKHISQQGIFPFVITGQDIDRKLYDHINSYTGELGSDGVVRVTSANLNSSYIKLQQSLPKFVNDQLVAPELNKEEFHEAPRTAMRIVGGKSHSGDDMGIMKSVRREQSDEKNAETVNAIFECVNVKSVEDYQRICVLFDQQTQQVQRDFLVEIERKLLKTNTYIHDRYCMVIFRVKDTEGYPISNFDLLLTGPQNDPDMLPAGFFADRQLNRSNGSTITYYFNYDVMTGADAIIVNGEEIRKALPGIDSLGLIVRPRPEEGFIRYLPCEIQASKELFKEALKPNCTTMIEICLRRIVSTEVFRFEKTDGENMPDKDFTRTKPGNNIVS